MVCLQDVSGAVHPELDLPLLHRAQLPAVDCLDQRGAADGALPGLLLLLLPGLAQQSEAVSAPVIGQGSRGCTELFEPQEWHTTSERCFNSI